ncbi:hypothetical protein FNF29_01225 [Cafeteria roenbergensis]|uniref:UDP-glucose:glycoprotein glucosyltransferase n=1 Tax=Cafeteria roenbergensis TaxID=33653 RepID=A0A5A8CTN2_CAFRO|nr:hypothetical protein FNF29_01225 [Cafeteria roenbergensis]|eukprot:KAA0156433.1 hypothetical protein FNF29_01225 [Cafeteria roenbergensis]
MFDVLQQASEFIADEDAMRGDESGSLFWGFVDGVHSLLDAGAKVDTAEDAAALAVTAASRVMQPLSVRVMRVSVAARAHAAAVEMHREQAVASAGRCPDSPDAWAVVLPQNRVACSAAELRRLIGAQATSGSSPDPPLTRLASQDHVLRSADASAAAATAAAASAAAGPATVVYGLLGTRGLQDLHEVAASAARRGATTYALRHWVPAGGAGNTRLAGWSAGLDVKNTEYRATDDRAGGPSEPSGREAAALRSVSPADAHGTPLADVVLEAAPLGALWGSDGKATLASDGAPGAGSAPGPTPDGPAGAGSSAGVLAALLEAHKGWRAADPSLPDASTMHVRDVNATGIGVKTTAYLLQASGRFDEGVAFAAQRDAAVSQASAKRHQDAVERKRARMQRLAKRTGKSMPDHVQLSRNELVLLAREPLPGIEPAAVAQARFDKRWASNQTAPEALSPAADPLALLSHLTGNFPAAAAALSTAPVDPALLSALRSSAYSVPHGQNIVLVNGRQIDATASSFNFFSVLRTLQDEASVLSQFASLPIAEQEVLALRALAAGTKGAEADGDDAAASADPVSEAEGGSPTLRVDYRSGADDCVVWLSDVEKDAQFRRMRASVRALLTQTWQLHQVRRNLYTAVLLGDASSPGGLRAILTALYFVQNALPIKFGFVPVASPADAPTEDLEAAAARFRTGAASKPDAPGGARAELAADDPVNSLDVALLALAAERNLGRAASSAFLANLAQAWQESVQARAAKLRAQAKSQQELQQLLQGMDINVAVSAEQAIDAFVEASASASGGTSLFGNGKHLNAARAALADATGEGRAHVLRIRKWAASHGLPSPGFLVNGRPGSGLAVQEEVVPQIQADLRTLQNLVRLGHLDDDSKSDALAVLLSSAGAVPVYHRAALDTSTSPFVPLASAAAAPLLWGVRYFHAPGTADVAKTVTVTLLDDLNSRMGVESALAALQAAAVPSTGAAARVGVVHSGPSPANSPGTVAAVLTAAAWAIGDDDAAGTVKVNDRLPAFTAVVSAAKQALAAGGPSPAQATVSALLSAGEGEASSLSSVISGRAFKRIASVVKAASSPSGKVARKAAKAAAEARGAARSAASVAGAVEESGAPSTGSALVGAWSRAEAARGVAAAVVPRVPAPAGAPAGAVPKPGPDGTVRAILTNGRVVALRREETVSPEVVSAAVGAEDRARGTRVQSTLSAASILSVLPDEDDAAAKPSSAHLSGPWAVKADDATAEFTSALIAAASSAVGAYGAGGVRHRLPHEALDTPLTSFLTFPASVLAGTAEPSGVEVEALLDPVSEAAQRAAPLLQLLRDAMGARVRVYLHPSTNMRGTGEDSDRKLPLSSFYRFAGPGMGPGAADSASFDGLPPFLLTAKVYPPEPWVVQTDASAMDTDNIQLARGERLAVRYGLRSLLVAGQCDELGASAPPNGLQLQLGPAPGLPATAAAGAPAVLPSSPDFLRPMADTLVMQNLGYFQLKAQPGVRALALAPGRATQLYDIVIPEGAGRDGRLPGEARSGVLRNVGQHQQRLIGEEADDDEPEMESVASLEVTVRDFVGDVTQLRVRRRPGFESAKLLVEEEEEAAEVALQASQETSRGFWGSVRSFFGGKASASSTAVAGKDDRIHVFSLASGHLYERFLKIMMLSVTKRSSRPVTFWLVENFLSPQFKETVPALAESAGFEVKMVTYKWPNWLRGQTEKQRIIWGYKILFLDVLFPLDLDKVIYVDADQVVRADLAELWDLDLEGAPYGYTPFCTSREETLGFQFWRQGYWKDHLRGKPYHISALYVVDLKRFRRQAVGDKLRAVYDQLSRDPNSLSNLDQDLPNYAQGMVPIKSLPQEWLWCESWCSDSTKGAAKTIDLCNNPLHKEPKLDMARRVISGELFNESWVELDAEAARSEGRAPPAAPAAAPAATAEPQPAATPASDSAETGASPGKAKKGKRPGKASKKPRKGGKRKASKAAAKDEL